MKRVDRRARRRSARAVDADRPGLGRSRLGRPALAPADPAGDPLRHGLRRPRRPAPGRLRPTPGSWRASPRRFELPALRPFPAAANLLIETPAEGRTAALAVLQASMFRLLTSLPPGMVRFTIVDPIGIGRNFGAFMHLADFDPALVTNQVWTDPRQIEERLAELELHMETVTQKYLRNEYATIEAYNAVAGEVAEPYRVLVVADFPTKFDEKSAGRLAAIAAGGVPCGVLTLVAVDTVQGACPRASARRPSPLLRPPDLDRRPARLGRPRPRPLPAGARPAPARRVRHPADPEGGRGGPRRQARRGPLRVHRPAAERLVDPGQPRGHRRPPGQGRARPSGSTWRWAREPASTS